MACIGAYEDRQNDDWQKFRMLDYTIYCALTDSAKRVTIYDYLPLPSDPTKEEIKEMEASRHSAKMDYWKKRLGNSLN